MLIPQHHRARAVAFEQFNARRLALLIGPGDRSLAPVSRSDLHEGEYPLWAAATSKAAVLEYASDERFWQSHSGMRHLVKLRVFRAATCR
jgi:hypothetical protein